LTGNIYGRRGRRPLQNLPVGGRFYRDRPFWGGQLFVPSRTKRATAESWRP